MEAEMADGTSGHLYTALHRHLNAESGGIARGWKGTGEWKGTHYHLYARFVAHTTTTVSTLTSVMSSAMASAIQPGRHRGSRSPFSACAYVLLSSSMSFG